MGAEELLPLRGSPSHSSTDGSRRGSPERGSGRSVLQAFPQTGGLSAFAAFVTGALLVACLLLATGSVQWSRESVVPLRTTLSTSGGAGQASPNGAAQQQLRLPWPPLLSAADVQRGITYHGTGARLQAVAAKLLAGQPIKAYTLGGSVTKGQGASTDGAAYPHRFFEFIRAAFPHSKHVLLNKGIGGTSSGIFAACAEQLVAPDADLVFVEFTVNDRPDLPLTDPQRKGFEQLLRKLLRLPGRPAVVLLHHYPWWRASGDGRRLGLFYYPLTEQHFTLLAHYYDLPSVSVRAALYPLMINAVDGFKVDKVTQRHRHMPNGRPLPAAAAEERASYFYADRTHPNDRGHQVLAELLAGLVLGAAHEQQRQQGAGKAEQHAAWAQRSTKVQQALTAIPPPMIPGNAEEPTSLCAIQEAFQSVVVAHQGFEWRAERPEEATFVGQKWAWTASQPGDWAELQFDSRDAAGPLDAAAGSTGAADASPAEEAAAEAADEEEEEEEEEEGPRRRNGRRTVGAVAGVVTLKPGETAGQWLNRSIVAYVGTLARERDFRPFEKPVPRSTPDYYALVKKPMDMATVKIKAQRGQYSSPKEFKSDMMLIVDNAKFYNESEKHPVHKAADLLRDYLRKPHSFFSKVDAEFKQAETAAVLNEERAAQEAELELEEERLARSVKKGMIVAVYGADDINGNKYYLLQATGPMLRLRADDTDDFGVTYGKGDTVIEGHYYDYWNRADGEWDRSGGRRPYFLLENMRGLVPASSLLLVDVKLRERPETEISPFVGEQTIYEVSPELHKQLKKAIKKFTAEPAA